MKKRIIFLLLVCVFATPLFSWYYFTASNKKRKQWVFSSSCNTNARPIKIYYDTDLPTDLVITNTSTSITNVINNYNSIFTTELLCNTTTCTPYSAPYQRALSVSSVQLFVKNPEPGNLWVVWDADGAVLNYFGLDSSPSAGLLGIGLNLTPSSSNPHHICSGLLILNAKTINNTSQLMSERTRRLQFTFMHELGHALGMAHSAVGYNGSTVTLPIASLPVMAPFYSSTGPTSLTNDDIAGLRALYQ